jgi:F-type H+-transporting ATPase subunit b
MNRIGRNHQNTYRQCRWPGAGIMSALLLIPSAALGSGDGSGPQITNWLTPFGEVNSHAPALGWMFLMFSMFVGGLYYFSRRPFKTMLINRHELVKKALEQASQAKAQAEEKKREYDERLKGLDTEINKILSEFEERGNQEKKRLEALGRSAAERIRKDAVATIAAEKARAEKELRLAAAQISVDLAEQKVKSVMDQDDEKRIKNEFLRELSH